MKIFAYFGITLCLLETSLGISWETSSFIWKSGGVDVQRFQRVATAGKVHENTVLKPTSLLALSKETEIEADTKISTKYYVAIQNFGHKILSTLKKSIFTALMGYEKLLHWIVPVVLPFSIVGLMLNTQIFHNWGYQQSLIVKNLTDQMNQVLPYVLPVAILGSINRLVFRAYHQVVESWKSEETPLDPKRNANLHAMQTAFYLMVIAYSGYCIFAMSSLTPMFLSDILHKQSDYADWQKLKAMVALLGLASWDHPVIANSPANTLIVGIVATLLLLSFDLF